MQQKIHMHDQVLNKIDDIMNHYKRKPIEEFMELLKQLRQLAINKSHAL
jgi:hypothetical protein